MRGAGTTEAEEVRARLEAVLGRARTTGDRLPGEPVAPDDLDDPGLRGRGRGGAHGPRGARGRDERDVDDLGTDGRGPDLVEGLGLWPQLRAALADRVPLAVRRGRWSVPLPAVTAALLVAAVVVVALAVRSSATAPGLPVPVRAAAASSPAAPGSLRGAAPTGAPAATSAPAAAPAPDPLPAGTGPAPAPAPSAGPREVVVHVVGRVAAPGVVRLPAGARVVDALAAAGGAAADADLARVNLARPVVDGEQVLVPAPGEELPAPAGAAPAGAPTGGAAATSAGTPAPAAAPALLDLNAAGVEDLDQLPGIGPVLAQRIVDTRAELGAFTSVEELGEVSGIGEARLADLRDLVTL